MIHLVVGVESSSQHTQYTLLNVFFFLSVFSTECVSLCLFLYHFSPIVCFHDHISSSATKHSTQDHVFQIYWYTVSINLISVMIYLLNALEAHSEQSL